MDPIQMMKGIINFNRKAFNGTFSAMMMFQEQSEKIVISWFDRNKFFPEYGNKIANEWVEACKKYQNEFKENVDRIYTTMEEIFGDLKK